MIGLLFDYNLITIWLQFLITIFDYNFWLWFDYNLITIFEIALKWSCQKLNLNKLAKNEKLIYHHGPFFTIQEVSVWTKSTCSTQLSDFVAQWREGISSQKYFGSRINSLWECLVFLWWFPWICFQRDERGMYNDFFSLFIIFSKELYFPDFLTVSCPSSSTTYIIQIDRNL